MERVLSLNCEGVPVQQNMASADCPVSWPGERHQFRRASRRSQPTARTAAVWGAASASFLAAAAAIWAVASLAAAVGGAASAPSLAAEGEQQLGELLEPPL